MTNTKDDKPKERQSLTLFNKFPAEVKEKSAEFLKKYETILANGKTPYDYVKQIKEWAAKEGFVPVGKANKDAKLCYITNHDETNIAFIKRGESSIKQGCLIIGAHTDSPCLTAKIHPIQEKPEGVVLDCYPYGGIYPHQWFDSAVTIIANGFKDGKTLRFEMPGFLTDATIHLSATERKKKDYDGAFEPENLDVFTGYETKEQFLAFLKKEHNVAEEDFARMHISVVPSNKPYILGEQIFAAFGQDDKICGFAQMQALLFAKSKKPCVAMLFDREEIGSTGYNGAQSNFVERVFDTLCKLEGLNLTEMERRDLYEHSQMISADVDVAYNSQDVPYSDKDAASCFGVGLIMDRNNGGMNQYMGNNVSMQVTDMYMELFKKADVAFKVSAIPPKVNTGGGGTISKYFNHKGIPTVDMGVAVMNMHGKNSLMYIPDFYQMIKGFTVFYEQK